MIIGGNGSSTGTFFDPQSDPSPYHTLYGGSKVLYGQMNENGELSSLLFPSTLTPNLSNLNLLCMGGEGIGGISPNALGYFESPRPDRGGGGGGGHMNMSGIHSSMTPGQFFMFGPSGRTPSSAPFSAGVSEVDSGYKNQSTGSLSLSGFKGVYRNRTDYFRTGLTPATNDTDSPLKPSNSNTPLSDIGDISISSSVFSPSFSPHCSYSFPPSTDGKKSYLRLNGEDKDRDRDREREKGKDNELEREREREKEKEATRSPRTVEALTLLADCVTVRQQYGHALGKELSSSSSSSFPTPQPAPRMTGSSSSSSLLHNETLSALSVERSFSMCSKHFPIVSTKKTSARTR